MGHYEEDTEPTLPGIPPAPQPKGRPAAETEFINQKTRELMVGWADDTVVGRFPAPMPGQQVYFDFAKQKKWISADGTRVLASGFETAARFLKR
jgi:hypothetical protein